MVSPGGHTDLDVSCALGDYLADRQDDLEVAAAFGDEAYLIDVPPGVAGLEADEPTGVVTDGPAA
jgi:hypothetical protein